LLVSSMGVGREFGPARSDPFAAGLFGGEGLAGRDALGEQGGEGAGSGGGKPVKPPPDMALKSR
jgi:hypothetical protein